MDLKVLCHLLDASSSGEAASLRDKTEREANTDSTASVGEMVEGRPSGGGCLLFVTSFNHSDSPVRRMLLHMSIEELREAKKLD